MKLVKFNVNTEFHNIPDQDYTAELKRRKDLRFSNFKEYKEMLLNPQLFDDWEYIRVGIGDEKEVPNWYYEAHKNDKIEISVAFDKYTDKMGNRIPFKMEEAVRHRDVQDENDTMRTVTRFELIKDLDKKETRQ